MQTLTEQQRHALMMAANTHVRVVMPGVTVGRREITYATAQALLTWQPAKLVQTVTRDDDHDPLTAAIVTITDAGRAELAKPIPDTPRFLTWAARPRGSELGYTDRAERGMGHDEPEPVDDATQERITLGGLLTAEQRRRQLARDARQDLLAGIAKLEPLAKQDKRIADRVRLLRRNLQAIDNLINDDQRAA